MNIQMFQRYRRLVDAGMVKPLTCGKCEQEYILRASEDGDPLLQCLNCDRMVQPGLRLYDQVCAVVREHSE